MRVPVTPKTPPRRPDDVGSVQAVEDESGDDSDDGHGEGKVAGKSKRT
jgi:hypothetical protein